MSYTKGKWTVGIYETTPTMLERMKNKQVAVCSDADPSDPKGLLIALCGDINLEEPLNTQASFADARLIAAAPDMIGVLERMLRHYEDGLLDLGTCGYIRHDLRNVIMKARGE